MPPPAPIASHQLRSRHLIVRVLAVVGAVSVLLTCLAALVGYWTAAAIDTRSAEREAHFVANGIDEIRTQLPVEQESVTIWDDAVAKLRQGDDMMWLDENLGTWMGSYFGHSRVYVLDPDDRPVYAMANEAAAPPEQYARVGQEIAPLVAEVRRQISEATDTTPAAIGALGAIDLIPIADRLAFVSVKPIVPSSHRVWQAPGMEFLHISVRNIDWQLLAGIGSHYALDGLTLAPPDDASEPAVALTNRAGEQLASLQWQPDQPGKAMISLLAPLFFLAVILASLLFALLLRGLWRSGTVIEAGERHTRFLALHDPLTGLPNRALFESRIEGAIAGLADPGNGQVALHLIDIDRFKNVNDTMGHPAGDELVRQIAARLAAVLSPGDTVARIGGDEFAVIQVGVRDEGEVEELAQRLGASVRNPFNLDGEHLLVTASIGIVVSEALPTSKAELLRRADIALYEAKSRGRGRHVAFREEMDSSIRHRRAIERDLRAALTSGRGLHVEYQPLFAADGITVVGAEALARWHHPTLGALSPDLFVEIAEERGLIDALGDWVMEQACEVLRTTGVPRIAVNVSPIQLRKEGFSQHILTLLRHKGIAPERVELEVTESVLIEEGPLAEWTLSELRDQGISVVLDDFGTGYSSMSYLHRYEVDKIKIDKSFVRRLGASSSADAIVRAIVSLARAMNRRVTAEGVETEEQRDQLVALGCDELQGFLLCRPLPAEALAELLDRRVSRLRA